MRGIASLIERQDPQTLVRLARGIAWLFFDVLRIRRRLILQNITQAFGDTLTAPEKQQMARESIFQFLLTIFEVMHCRSPRIADQVGIEGAEHLQSALDQGRGAFILCCHMGNWEVMGATVNRHFALTKVLVKKVGSDLVNQFVEERRHAIGMNTIERSSPLAAIKTIKATLKDGHIVGFVLDQSRPGEPRLPFFNKPAKTNTGLATMWQRTKAPIIPAYIQRRDFDQHVLHLLPALELTESGDRDQDVLTHTQQFNQVLETMIRRNPTQYFWLHNRWK